MADNPMHFDSIDDLPWPQKGDKLFRPDKDWWNNACLNYLPDDWELYVIGYKHAAEVLVAYIVEKHSEQDTLVFPIVFLYRQYLELRLKRLITDGSQLLDVEKDFPKTHELGNLWGDCKKILSKLEPKIPKEDLEAVEDAIKQFTNIDPSSETFRYPIHKDGRRLLPPEIKYINLRNLAEVMDKIVHFLDSASMMISVYLDYKADMEAEWQE